MVIETTPRYMTNKIKEFCKSINPSVEPVEVAVIPDDGALCNECFPNVQSKICRDGGTAVCGWAIWQWANILIEAEAHCVWKNNDNQLIDITPHISREAKILFVPDDTIEYKGIVIPSKRVPLTASKKVDHFIDLLTEKDNKLEQSGTSKTCSFPAQFLVEIQRVKTDITRKVSRNDPCPCGSGLKYKKCCGPFEI